VSEEYDVAAAQELKTHLKIDNDSYPDYLLYLADDMKLIASPEELYSCVKKAMETNAFETLYLGKIGEGARLIRQTTSANKKICLLEPPLFARVKQSLSANKTLAKHSPKQGYEFASFVGLLFIAMLTVAVMYLARRRHR